MFGAGNTSPCHYINSPFCHTKNYDTYKTAVVNALPGQFKGIDLS